MEFTVPSRMFGAFLPGSSLTIRPLCGDALPVSAASAGETKTVSPVRAMARTSNGARNLRTETLPRRLKISERRSAAVVAVHTCVPGIRWWTKPTTCPVWSSSPTVRDGAHGSRTGRGGGGVGPSERDRDLAAHLAGLELTHRLRGLREWIGPVEGRDDGACLDQLGHP